MALPCNGTACEAVWAAWIRDDHLLVYQRTGQLSSFLPGTSICHSRHILDSTMHDYKAPQLLAPNKAALLCPVSLANGSLVLLLSLPSLTKLYQLSCPSSGTENLEFSPSWLGWSSSGDKFAIAWAPLHVPEGGAHVRLDFYSMADGSVQSAAKRWSDMQGPNPLTLKHQRKLHLQYQWMSQSDCVVVMTQRIAHPPKEVAMVIACTGEVLQSVLCDYWTRFPQLSPSGEFMDLYGNDPDGHFADPTILSLYHLRSGKLVSSSLANTETALTCSTLWHGSNDICTNMADYMASRQIVFLDGQQDARGIFCKLPAHLERCQSSGRCTACFSPCGQLLVEMVPTADCDGQLAHWTWSMSSAAADLHLVDLPRCANGNRLDAAGIVWHPSPLAHIYAVLSSDSQHLYLISARTHTSLVSWAASSVFACSGATFRKGSFEWSPDGSQLVAVGTRNHAAVTIFFD